MSILQGGPYDGTKVTGNDIDKIWIVLYTINGKLWKPPYGVFYQDFPPNTMKHGYRKQKTGNFTHAWSRNNLE